MKLHLAEGLALPPAAVTQTFAILGVRGSGKSNTAVVLAEEMFGAKLPFVVIDPVGTWWGLRSSKDGKGAGLAVPVFGGRHGDVPLEKTGGQLLADLVVDERLSCVFDVAEFSEGDKIRFLIDFAERLYRRNQDPLHLFLEEADDYAPQRPFREQARLLRAWENVVRRGRARGLGITMISQRSAALNKNVLTQIETLIVLRTTSPQDRKAIGAWVEYHGQSEELLESLPGLQDGEAWVWSPHWLTVLKRARIRRRETFDSAATPKQEAGQRRAPATLADVDLKAIEKRMVATIERAKAEDPRELRRRIAGLEAEKKEWHKNAIVAPPKRVEVPILKDGQIKRLEAAVHASEKLSERTLAALSAMAARTHEVLQALRAHREPVPVPSRLDDVRVQQGGSGPTKILARPTAIMVSRSAEPGSGLPVGEIRILTAIAQHGADGVTREQLSMLTGYKRSSRDTYLQRLLARGYFIFSGDQLLATEEGVAALGRDFVPLPVGLPLQEYWMGRLPVGEAKLLEILLNAYPKAVDREVLADKTGYKRSSRDTYLQRLHARRLIVLEGRGAVRAHELLFAEGP